jgi:hypothetical protein
MRRKPARSEIPANIALDVICHATLALPKKDMIVPPDDHPACDGRHTFGIAIAWHFVRSYIRADKQS